jgi:hypothetical protein
MVTTRFHLASAAMLVWLAGPAAGQNASIDALTPHQLLIAVENCRQRLSRSIDPRFNSRVSFGDPALLGKAASDYEELQLKLIPSSAGGQLPQIRQVVSERNAKEFAELKTSDEPLPKMKRIIDECQTLYPQISKAVARIAP